MGNARPVETVFGRLNAGSHYRVSTPSDRACSQPCPKSVPPVCCQHHATIELGVTITDAVVDQP